MGDTSISADVQVKQVPKGDIAKVMISGANFKTSLPREIHDAFEMYMRRLPETWEHVCWSLVRDGLCVGYVLIWHVDEANENVQVIAAFSEGIGLSEIGEALQKVFTSIFSEKKIHKVSLLTHPEHHFFFSVAQHASMLLEGTLRKHICVGERWFDVTLFSQIVDEGAKNTLSLFEILRRQTENVDKIVVRAVILQMQQNNIEMLLLKKIDTLPMPGFEEPPGGALEKNESFFEALQRIVRSEIGLSISSEILYLTSFNFSSSRGERVREFVFRVTPCFWNIDLDTAQYESYHWIPLQDLVSTPLHPELVHVLTNYSTDNAYTVDREAVKDTEVKVELTKLSTDQLEEALLTGIHLEAYAAKGCSSVEPVGIALRDSGAKIVGGLVADFEYGAMNIRRLWVNQDWRRSGWDKRLLMRAEKLAQEKQCLFISAHVMDWEDLPVFQQNGYQIETQHSGFVQGSRQYCFRKELAYT